MMNVKGKTMERHIVYIILNIIPGEFFNIVFDDCIWNYDVQRDVKT